MYGDQPRSTRGFARFIEALPTPYTEDEFESRNPGNHGRKFSNTARLFVMEDGRIVLSFLWKLPQTSRTGSAAL